MFLNIRPLHCALAIAAIAAVGCGSPSVQDTEERSSAPAPTETIGQETQPAALDDPGALSDRGLVLAQAGQYEEALAEYDRALEIKPDFAGAYRGRAIVLRNLDETEAALEDLQKAAELFVAQGQEDLAQKTLDAIDKLQSTPN